MYTKICTKRDIKINTNYELPLFRTNFLKLKLWKRRFAKQP